jgi:hypothetical protein
VTPRRRRRAPVGPVPEWLIQSPAGVSRVAGSLRKAQLAAEQDLQRWAREHGVSVYATRFNDRTVTATTYDDDRFEATLEVAA